MYALNVPLKDGITGAWVFGGVVSRLCGFGAEMDARCGGRMLVTNPVVAPLHATSL